MKRLISQIASAVSVVALLALGAGNAAAQNALSPPPGAGESSSPAAAPNAAANAPNSSASTTPMKDPLTSEDISQIDGVSVAGSDGSSIGKISTVLMNPSTKKIDRLVVAEGGVLGVGAHNVALPVDAFRWDAQNNNFVVQKTADDLKAMPEWQKPQLAEAPSGSSTSTSSSSGTSRSAGVAAGNSAGAPAGAASAPMTPHNTANEPAH